MEHVKRLVLVPEYMVDQRKKPLVPPLTAQVQEIDSDMQDIMQRQDIPIDAQAKVYDQNLERYLTFYDKRINKPLRVNVVKPVPEEEERAQGEIKFFLWRSESLTKSTMLVPGIVVPLNTI